MAASHGNAKFHAHQFGEHFRPRNHRECSAGALP
jgi:hypothetical protein